MEGSATELCELWQMGPRLTGPRPSGVQRLGGGEGRGESGTYHQVLLLEHGNPVLALLLVFPDGLVDTRIERVELHFPPLLLFQSILENVQANDDKFVLVGEWLLRKTEAVSGAGLGGGS